jgi:CheY-like chemotaxis protein
MKSAGHILVVDDDPEDHMILLEYFKEAGREKQVTFLENGQRAMDFLDELHGDELLPKLVVLDLNMPVMNGIQTLLQLKQLHRYKHIPVIVFSTSENENEKRKCLSFGAADYVVKPSSWEDGLRMIALFTSYL